MLVADDLRPAINGNHSSRRPVLVARLREGGALEVRRMMAGNPSGCKTASPAFSLVELVVVVAIIGIISAIAVPRFLVSLSRYHADAAANCVAAQLRHAAAEARFSSCSRTVTLDPSDSTLLVYDPSAAAGQQVVDQVDLAKSPFDSKVTQSDFASGSPLTFDGYGQPSRSASVTLESGDQSRVVSIDGATGEVSIR